MREAKLGENHPDTLETYANLAAILGWVGEHKEAEILWRRVLGLREKYYSDDTIVSLTERTHYGSVSH